jgi:cell division protein FtsW
MSRADQTFLGEWWWTIDRLLLGAVVTLMIAGIVVSFAASPPVAERLGLPLFHFVNRHIAFLPPSLGLMIAVSFLDPRDIRRLSLLAFAVAWSLMVAALYIGPEIKGAHRWLSIAGIAVQPSEFVKPAFVVLSAWLFGEAMKRSDVPGRLLAMVLLGMTVGVLLLQPDLGQTVLLTAVWGALFFLSGLPWIFVIVLGGLGVVGIGGAYVVLPHVKQRIDRFLDPESGDTYQIDRSIEAFTNGGWFGTGPGEGTVKRGLPDSHTDFVFAVTGEEFGAIACMGLALLFGFIVLRGLNHALRDHDPFTRLAVSGLSMLFGLQSCINMMVNLHLMPAKGMTLPFISSGGSSMISLALGMGMLLALTRRRPRADLHASDMAAEARRMRLMPAAGLR